MPSKRSGRRPGIVFYFNSFRPILENLDREWTKDFLLAILDYAEAGIMPSFDNPVMTAFFGILRPSIDADAAKYEKTVLHTAYMGYKRKGGTLAESDWIAAGQPEAKVSANDC